METVVDDGGIAVLSGADIDWFRIPSKGVSITRDEAYRLIADKAWHQLLEYMRMETKKQGLDNEDDK